MHTENIKYIPLFSFYCMLTTSTNLVVLMQNGIVQRSAQSIAGHWQKNSRQVLCSPVPEDLIFHPCERSWKRLSGLFSSLWKKSMCFRLIVAVIFSINLSLSQMFFGYDFFAYCFSFVTCVLKMHSWWYSLKHDCFFYSKSSGSVRIAEMSSALITVLSS